MRYYMQQEVRCKSCKKESSTQAGERISEAHRSGVCFAVQSGHHSEKKHFESQDADSQKCSGKVAEAGRDPDFVRQGCFAIPFILLIKFYRRFISPLFPPCCRFSPTCSMYAIQAFSVHGVLKGFLLSAWRILRCNPFVKGGYDPVPPKGRWRPLNFDPDKEN